MAPGSQTFEQALFRLFMDGQITQEEAMSNADSATNMLWLINQATAGEVASDVPAQGPEGEPLPAEEQNTTEDPFSRTADIAEFRDIKIDMS
jgi:twitching motility protein PilU